MEKPDDKNSAAESQHIEAIFREHDRLEQLIREKFTKEVTILFTDICGYTHYMETKGDIRAMLQKHNDILFPLIKRRHGLIVKTIGDAVMAMFESPSEAVRAGADIQKKLQEYNRTTASDEEIHVKIGINSGQVLLDEADIFGDAVNVAARIQAKAGKDEILISENMSEQICGSGEFICKFHDTAELRGKAEPANLYQILWKDEDIVLSEAPRVRSYENSDTGERSETVLHIDVMRVADRLKISAYEKFVGESETVLHYREIPIPIDIIDRRCREIAETLNKANRQGRVSRDILVRLREIGQVFFDDLFTQDVKQKVRNTAAEHLILNLDDTLVHIPWELLYDGRQFLSQRFSMGRLVRTKQKVPGSGRLRKLTGPLKMLILADPGGDLNGAYAEGKQLRDYIDEHKKLVSVSLLTQGITSEYIREKIRNFDFAHYAGHSDYDHDNPGESGWRLKKERFRAREIVKMAGAGSMPSLIFSNACQSARTEGWEIRESFHDEIFGLANAFVLSGVRHYVGTFWEVLDQPSRRFAVEFYKQLFSGQSVGMAVRRARLALIREYGEETIVWASYLLYGDPTFNYAETVAADPEDAADREHGGNRKHRTAPGTKIRAQNGMEQAADRKTLKEEVVDFSLNRPVRKKGRVLKLGAVILLLLGVFLWGYPGILRNGTAEYEKAALKAHRTGDFQKALNLCQTLEKKNPRLRLIYLIRGDVYLRQGKPDAAQTEYRQALEASEGTSREKADALVGLGRIASLRKQTETALDYYRQATETAPGEGSGYLSRAMLLNETGNYQESLQILDKARSLLPENRLIASLAGEIRRKVSSSEDQEKQKRINRLVQELLAMEKAGTQNTVSHDKWTSRAQTLWIMDFETQGYAALEGEERLLGAGIADALIGQSHIQLVERALLDKLLGELSLGTSELADPDTALSMGRLMAARLIVSGRIIYSGPRTQVSLRVIETETGLISAAISESFGRAIPVWVMADKLSENLLDKIKKRYPLRALVSEVRGGEITLRIGEKTGMAVGQRFRVVGKDAVLEIVSVGHEMSVAEVREGEEEIEEGDRVEMQQKGLSKK